MGPNRVLSDTELAEFGYVSRLVFNPPNHYDRLDAYPGTRRYQSEVLRDGKYVGGFSNCKMGGKWLAFDKAINTPAQYKAQWVPQFGWHNFGDVGVVEYVVFIDDTLWVDKIVGNKAYIRSLCLQDAPPDTSKNFWDEFTMVFFSVITRDGRIISHDAGWIRTLVLRREKTERLWIDAKYLTAL